MSTTVYQQTRYHYLVVGLAGNAVTSKPDYKKQKLPDLHNLMLVEYTGYCQLVRTKHTIWPMAEGMEELLLVEGAVKDAGKLLWNKFGVLKTEMNNVLNPLWRSRKITSGQEVAD
jgi:hypothetical protein